MFKSSHFDIFDINIIIIMCIWLEIMKKKYFIFFLGFFLILLHCTCIIYKQFHSSYNVIFFTILSYYVCIDPIILCMKMCIFILVDFFCIFYQYLVKIILWVLYIYMNSLTNLNYYKTNEVCNAMFDDIQW